MAIEIGSGASVCCKCGTAYGHWKSAFPVSYSLLYKGTGRIPICRNCIDQMYQRYLAQCNDARHAMRQLCRKLDLYWSDGVFDQVFYKSTPQTLPSQYIARTNIAAYAGKSYDDTLADEGTLWDFAHRGKPEDTEEDAGDDEAEEPAPAKESEPEEDYDVSEEVKLFWGTGLSQKDYYELEQRRKYWMSRYPNDGRDIDIGTEALIRQICNLEIDINKQRTEGKPIDKSVNMLNTLLGSLNLKPMQRGDDSVSATLDTTPFGVGISWCEQHKPIREPSEEFKDVDGIRRYILIWFVGHLAHMLGIKNKYSRLYDEEMARLRVEGPEYADEDDVDFVYDIFKKDDGDEGDGET